MDRVEWAVVFLIVLGFGVWLIVTTVKLNKIRGGEGVSQTFSARSDPPEGFDRVAHKDDTVLATLTAQPNGLMFIQLDFDSLLALDVPAATLSMLFLFPDAAPKNFPLLPAEGTMLAWTEPVNIHESTTGILLSQAQCSVQLSADGVLAVELVPTFSAQFAPGKIQIGNSGGLMIATTQTILLEPAFTLEIDTGLDAPEDTFLLPVITGHPDGYDYLIDWGDGEIEYFDTGGDKSHMYAEPNTKTRVRVYGDFHGIKYDGRTEAQRVTSVLHWGSSVWSTMEGAFSGCSNLVTIYGAGSDKVLAGVSNWKDAFLSCSSMSSIGADFRMDGAVDLESCFEQCSALLSFPQMDLSHATMMLNTWSNCTLMQSFGPITTTAALTNLRFAWRNCLSMVTFPAMDTSQVTDMYQAWSGCSALTAFPTIDTSNVITMVATWSGCSALTAFPTIDTSNVTTMVATFGSCTLLSSVPALDMSSCLNANEMFTQCGSLTAINTVNFPLVLSLGSTWRSCSALTTVPLINAPLATNWSGTFIGVGTGTLTSFAAIPFPSMDNGTSCFIGTTITQADWDAVLIAVAAANTTPSVTFNGPSGVGHGAAANAAFATLTDPIPGGLGWTITE